MDIRANGGRRGCPGRGAAVPPARSWLGAGRSAGARPKGLSALPFETEFRTGKVKAGVCGPCFSKGLEESRIESGVKRSSQNRSSGRESALIFREDSERTHGRVAQVPGARVSSPAAVLHLQPGTNNPRARRPFPPLRVGTPALRTAGRCDFGTWATRPHVGCYEKWSLVIAAPIKNRAAVAAPFWPGRKGQMGHGAPVRHSVPNGANGEGQPPSELSSEGCQVAMVTLLTLDQTGAGAGHGRQPARVPSTDSPLERNEPGWWRGFWETRSQRAGACPACGGREPKASLFAMEYVGNQKLGDTYYPSLVQPDQTKSNQIKPNQTNKIMKDEG